MEDVLKSVNELKAHISILVKQNADNQAKIFVLENGLAEREDRIKELEMKADTASAAQDKKFRVLKAKMKSLGKRQQQQIQESKDKFRMMDTLQHLLNGAILKKVAATEKGSDIEVMISKLDTVNEAVTDLQGKADHTSSQVDELSSQCTSIRKEYKGLQVNAGKTSSQMDNLSSKCSSVYKAFEELQVNAGCTSSQMDKLSSMCTSIHKEFEELQANAGRTFSQMDQLSSMCTSIQQEFRDFQENAHRTSSQIDQLSSSCTSMNQEFQDLQANTGHTSSRMGKLSSMCTAIHKEFEDLQENASSTSSQMAKLSSMCASIHQEFQDLKSSWSKKKKTQQTTIEFSTVWTAPDVDVEREEHLRMEYDSLIANPLSDNLSDCLNQDDLEIMACIESMAGTRNGPAFKALTCLYAGSSKRAEKQSKKYMGALTHLGITDPLQAMEEYIKCRNVETYVLSRSRHWHQLDLVITRRASLNCVLTTRSYHSADCDTDHSLIGNKVRLQPKRIHRSEEKGRPRINTARTTIPDLCECFANSIEEALHDCPPNTAEERWNHTRDDIYNSAMDTFGKRERGRTHIASKLGLSNSKQPSQPKEKRYKREPSEKTLVALRMARNDAQWIA